MNVQNNNISANLYDSDDCLTLKTVRVDFEAYRVVIDSSGGGWAGSNFIVDFTTLVEMGHIEGVQSLYIQGGFPEGVIMTVQGTGQRIDLGNTQPNQVIPIFAPNPPVFEIDVSRAQEPYDWMLEPDLEPGEIVYRMRLLFANRKIYTR